jgi:hypothetical protein
MTGTSVDPEYRGLWPTRHTAPVAPAFASLWPEGTPGISAERAPGGVQQTKRGLVYDPPKKGKKKRPRPKKAR